MRALLFDTETTGKANMRAGHDASDQPHLVQVAAMLCEGDGFDEPEVLGQINFIVKPNGWEIPEESTAIHKIHHNVAVDVGVPLRIVLASMNHLAQSAEVLVAHNSDFDTLVMRAAYYRDGCLDRLAHKPVVCTMHAATPHCKLPKPWAGRVLRKGDEYKWPTLTEAYRHYFDETFEGAHNAMNDVTALARVFFRMVREGHITTETRRLA